MVVFLLFIIACCLLFGAENTKSGCLSVLIVLWVLLGIASIMSSCGMI